MMNSDGDLGRHLTLGEHILKTGNIPLQDLFSHTMTGELLTPHEWLSQVLFALAKRVFGFNGVILLCALIIATTIWLIYKQLLKETSALIPSVFVVLLVLINSMVHWLARPHIFTFLLLTIWMIMLDKLRTGNSKYWWTLPVIMLLWANLHGAFIAGFVTWLLNGAGIAWDDFVQKDGQNNTLPLHFWRSYLVAGVASFLTTLINPSGFGLWKTSVGYVGNKYLVDQTLEYQSPNFHDVKFLPFLITIVFLVVIIGLSKKRPKINWLLNTSAWMTMGLYSKRNIPLFAIVSAPLLAMLLNNWLFDTNNEMKLFKAMKKLNDNLQDINDHLRGYLWFIISIMVAIVGLRTGCKFDLDRQGYAFDPEVFPVEAVDWLQDNPQEGEMFNYFIWGGYLLYRLWPEERVFIDAQTDFYGEELTKQYGKVIFSQKGWQDVLDHYDVAWAILPVDEPAVPVLLSEKVWKVIYEDETAMILRR